MTPGTLRGMAVSALLLSALLPFSGCFPDLDGDGYVGLLDCDPFDASVNPGAAEVCDGIDQDCDGQIDDGLATTWYPDLDLDGYGDEFTVSSGCTAPDCYIAQGGDCDDADPTTNAGAPETCDGQDDNCDGQADEGVAPYHRDQDGDGFGTDDDVVCSPTAGYVAARADCDDGDASIHPGAADPVDAIDQDCGGSSGPEPHVGLPGSLFASIQAALNAAVHGNTVWVGPGTWLEHDLDFNGRAVRLEATHGAAATVVDAGGLGSVMRFSSGEGPSTVVRGFTLTNGDAPVGGGIYLSASSPTLLHLVVTGNTTGQGSISSTSHGAGLYLLDSHPSIAYCRIEDNGLGIARGAGLYLEQSDPSIFATAILDNSIGSGPGGGIYLDSSAPDIAWCDISLNTAYQGGGGIGMEDSAPTVRDSRFDGNELPGGFGGAVRMTTSSPIFTRCTFTDNFAEGSGGAIAATDSTLTLEHSLIEGNTGALGTGGGMVLTGTDGSIHHVTVRGNGTSGGGGGIGLSQSDISIDNSIIEDNTGFGQAGGGLSIFQSAPVITHTRVMGNYGDRKGGGLYLRESDATLRNVIVAGNQSSGITGFGGGGLFIENSSPTLENVVVVDNDTLGDPAYPGTGDGIYVYGAASQPEIRNSILAYNLNFNLYNSPTAPGSPTVVYTDVHNPGLVNNSNVALGATNETVEPGFLAYTAGIPSDYHLDDTSPLVDDGDPGILDPDGSTSDMGAYGGPGGGGWDLDGDCAKDWFWPGPVGSPPPGFSACDYDWDDLDGAMQQCGP